MMAMEHFYFSMKCMSIFLLHLLLLHYCSCSSQGLLNPNLTNVFDIYYPSCSTEKFGVNTTYQANLFTLLSYLSSNATVPNAEFYNTTVGLQNDPNSTVYGLFLCRGDIPHQQCQDCVSNATRNIASYCPLAKQAIIRQYPCFIRYSNINFFSRVDEQPEIFAANPNRVTDHESSFTWTLANTLNQVAAEAASCGPAGTKKFATREAQVPEGGRMLFTLAQCTPDLSAEDCGKCLNDMIEAIAGCCLGRIGGRFLCPSCSVRFELFQFYWHVTPCVPHRSLGSSVFKEKGKDPSRTILIVVFSSVSGILLFYVSYYLFLKKTRRNHKAILQKSFGDESATLEPLQFELAVIRAATNNFSLENRIGKGGFGEVYKGILLDGQQIAVKILSKCSKQGEDEFKNEVLLIAKLQHKNLVAFIGFCLEEQEKILIYEYMPNKSLDYFLFDVERQKLIQWSDRYNIIGGIAREILYLHEYSRLKVIHRDLKPSNVLLDENMIPKISDFGLARIVEINQDQRRTKRIVGTHGYMSPEYAMLGQFSEKSDIYSFGVMVLDIITGKRNVYSSKAQNVHDDLPSYVWRYWRDGTPLSILDQNIKENYSKVEVIKCIQIGLLCAQHDPDERPTMTSVVSYLTNHSIELPTPHEPAFFLSKRIDPKLVEESSSSRPGNSSRPSSTNEMSVSTFLPR